MYFNTDMRVSFKRMLFPGLVLVATAIAISWLYVSHTSLDQFTIRYRNTEPGLCGSFDIGNATRFQKSTMDFLQNPTDTNLISAFMLARNLDSLLKLNTTCPSLMQLSLANTGLTNELVNAIRLRQQRLVISIVDYPRSLMSPEETDSFKSTNKIIMSVAVGLDTTVLNELNFEKAIQGRNSKRARRQIENGNASNFADVNISQLAIHMSDFNQALLLLMDEVRREENLFNKALEAHANEVDQQKSNLFLTSLIIWFLSLASISFMYFRSALVRNRYQEALPLGKEISSSDPDTQISTKPREAELDTRESVAPTDLEQLHQQLSKVFFQCGGDMKEMNQLLNRYMTTVFASATNIRSQAKAGKFDGSQRTFSVLISHLEEMGLTDLVKLVTSTEKYFSDPSLSPGNADFMEIAEDLLQHVKLVKEQMSRLPNFR